MSKLIRVVSLAAILGIAVGLVTAQIKVDRRHDQGFKPAVEKEIYRSPGELKAQDEAELRAGLKYLKLIKGDPTSKLIALTFDDGPHPEWTLKLLEVLRQNQVKATFFVVGKMVDRYPDLIRAEVADGHQIANHTYHHLNLSNLSDEEVDQEYRMCDDSVFRATGLHMKYCRPPGGQYDHDVIKATEHMGLTTVLWTDDPGDYAKPGDSVLEKRLNHIHNGSIILLHDGIQQTIDILPDLIRALRKKGYRFVTVDELKQHIQSKLAIVTKQQSSFGKRFH